MHTKIQDNDLNECTTQNYHSEWKFKKNTTKQRKEQLEEDNF